MRTLKRSAAILIVAALVLAAGIAIGADIPLNEETVRQWTVLRRAGTLESTERLTNVPGLLALAQWTCPEDKFCPYVIKIRLRVVDVDPRLP